MNFVRFVVTERRKTDVAWCYISLTCWYQNVNIQEQKNFGTCLCFTTLPPLTYYSDFYGDLLIFGIAYGIADY